GQVDGQVQLPVGVVQVLELAHRIDDAGVVDADVDGPEVALDRRHRLADLARLAHVTRVAAGDPAGGADGLGRLLGALGVEIADGDTAALGGQRRRVGLTEAPGPAGDERHAIANAEIHASGP